MGGAIKFRRPASSMVLVAALAASVLLIGAAPSALADMSTSYVITGGGWGHGLGMSQYGARGYADKGWTATQIIQHYYEHTTVGTASVPSSIRVGIAQSYRSITL